MDIEELPGEPLPESRFFEPTPRCPNPGDWTSTDADSTEREVAELVGALVRAVQPERVVETGSAFGETTERIVAALHRNGHGFLVTLETNPERAAYVRDRIPASPQWRLDETSSLTWKPDLSFVAYPIGLVFLDTAREIRVDELLRFLPWMRPGAIAVVHDSTWDSGPLRGWIENSIVTPGYGRAVDLPTPRGVTIIEMLPGDGL